MLKALVSTCAAAALVCGLSAPAAAFTYDRTTRFTFNQPVAVPGVTLPAGTYTFRLADPNTGRKVVQVLNDRGTKSYAMFLTMPAYRADIANDPEISFMETGLGMPAAVQTWWQEGSTQGYEFVYPKEQALKLSRGLPPEPAFADVRSSADVSAEATSEGASAIDTTVEPNVTERLEASNAAEASAQQSQVTQPAPIAAQSQSASPVQEQPTTTVEQRRELPQTASSIPLTVLLGSLLVCGGAYFRRRARAE